MITGTVGGYRGLAANTDLDMRVGYDPASDRFWAHIHDTTNGQVLLDRADLADPAAVQRTVGVYGQVPGPVLTWLDRDRQQARERFCIVRGPSSGMRRRLPASGPIRRRTFCGRTRP